mmetsp:Transcript_5031/g.10880  ORF Transcript_5031/g.10880 Transcript_5031/m.10880 type:complete len:417 (+) Transcript_5031:1492-2742(+)
MTQQFCFLFHEGIECLADVIHLPFPQAVVNVRKFLLDHLQTRVMQLCNEIIAAAVHHHSLKRGGCFEAQPSIQLPHLVDQTQPIPFFFNGGVVRTPQVPCQKTVRFQKGENGVLRNSLYIAVFFELNAQFHRENVQKIFPCDRGCAHVHCSNHALLQISFHLKSNRRGDRKSRGGTHRRKYCPLVLPLVLLHGAQEERHIIPNVLGIWKVLQHDEQEGRPLHPQGGGTGGVPQRILVSHVLGSEKKGAQKLRQLLLSFFPRFFENRQSGTDQMFRGQAEQLCQSQESIRGAPHVAGRRLVPPSIFLQLELQVRLHLPQAVIGKKEKEGQFERVHTVLGQDMGAHLSVVKALCDQEIVRVHRQSFVTDNLQHDVAKVLKMVISCPEGIPLPAPFQVSESVMFRYSLFVLLLLNQPPL